MTKASKGSRVQRKRPGIYTRSLGAVPKRSRPATPEEILESLRKALDPMSISGRAARLSNLMTKLEADALSIYRAHGLPTEPGLYRVSAGEWEAVDGVPPPPAVGPSGKRVPQMGKYVRLEGVAGAIHGIDAEPSYAGAVLASIVAARPLVARAAFEGNILALELAEELFWASNYRAMHEVEFVWGHHLSNELDQIRNRSGGGSAKAQAENRPAEWAAWSACANEIWKRRPRLSKVRMAELVKAELGLQESVSIIRKRIEKVG